MEGGRSLFAPSKRASSIVAGFFLTATAVAAIGAGAYAISQEDEESPVTFADDNGENVTVTPNDDGTETATYDDGRSVTFRREDDGSLSYVSGTAALLGGLAASYLLSRGFSGGSGYFDTSRNMYRATTPYTYSRDYDNAWRTNGISRSQTEKGNTTSNSTGATAGNASVKSNSPSTGTTAKTAGGFGGAGARSAAS